MKTNTNIVLTVTDERDAVVSRTVGITFQPKVYWGKTNNEQLENADILALEGSSLAGGRGRTFTVNAGEGEKICLRISDILWNANISTWADLTEDLKRRGLWNLPTHPVTSRVMMSGCL